MEKLYAVQKRQKISDLTSKRNGGEAPPVYEIAGKEGGGNGNSEVCSNWKPFQSKKADMMRPWPIFKKGGEPSLPSKLGGGEKGGRRKENQKASLEEHETARKKKKNKRRGENRVICEGGGASALHIEVGGGGEKKGGQLLVTCGAHRKEFRIISASSREGEVKVLQLLQREGGGGAFSLLEKGNAVFS